MDLSTIKEQLVKEHKDPNDFNIKILENGYSVEPKWFYETKQIAKKEDKPIIEDVNDVAETIGYNLIDVNDLAEMLALALVEIDNLKSEIESLKGGSI